MLGKLIHKIKSQFEPRLATVEPLGEAFEVASDQTLLQGALAAGLAFPHHCTVGTCGNCKCRLTEGRCQIDDGCFSNPHTGRACRRLYSSLPVST